MVKGGEKVKRKSNNPAGRPRLTEDEKLVSVTARMRPGDVERLVAAARRRGVPTGSAIRDLMHAALAVTIDEPGAGWRAGIEAWRVELGLDQVEVVTRSTTAREKPPARARAAGGEVRSRR
jgi:hypothetical protein